VAAGHGSDQERAESFQRELEQQGVEATIHKGNVGSADDCHRSVHEVIDQHGRLDVSSIVGQIGKHRTDELCGVEVLHVRLATAPRASRGGERRP
jgi:hypothetical protein